MTGLALPSRWGTLILSRLTAGCAALMASSPDDCPAPWHLLVSPSWPHALICQSLGSPWLVSRLTAGTGCSSKCPGCTARCWIRGFSGNSLVYSD